MYYVLCIVALLTRTPGFSPDQGLQSWNMSVTWVWQCGSGCGGSNDQSRRHCWGLKRDWGFCTRWWWWWQWWMVCREGVNLRLSWTIDHQVRELRHCTATSNTISHFEYLCCNILNSSIKFLIIYRVCFLTVPPPKSSGYVVNFI